MFGSYAHRRDWNPLTTDPTSQEEEEKKENNTGRIIQVRGVEPRAAAK
jgi:hypothetical protein